MSLYLLDILLNFLDIFTCASFFSLFAHIPFPSYLYLSYFTRVFLIFYLSLGNILYFLVAFGNYFAISWIYLSTFWISVALSQHPLYPYILHIIYTYPFYTFFTSS